ncbi:hypothetical protein [Rhizobium leguminosarum]|jgi:hypothetical protein|uniref:hypothetical protein n=1 Tax=Rhizobium leguminosarum TaxID=384 RepID=UPI0010316CF6|nr:hypothetical protein [Rhizobium leguminosarum]TAY64942.1 hypothetical protein ELH82_01110 [Rhizobium leguminosarum]
MRTIVGLAAFLILAVAGIGFAYPAAAAAVCPSCYGFTGLGDNLYVEKNMTATEHANAETAPPASG